MTDVYKDDPLVPCFGDKRMAANVPDGSQRKLHRDFPEKLHVTMISRFGNERKTKITPGPGGAGER